jgi:REP element-mobilizing transposase RayT
MKKSKQLQLIPQKTNQRFFGGALLKGRRKSMRPLARNEAIHFVLRSPYAKGATSFRSRKNLPEIEKILAACARKYQVRIYRKAIQSNHIHLILKIHNRWLYRCFISVISGKIASLVMNQLSFQNFLKSLEPGEGCREREKGQAFWEFRPFSRILTWGKDYQNCCRYLLRNILEAFGFIAYKPRAKNFAYEKFILRPRQDLS